ncbi:MAG: hypothetical protein QM639_05480 [Rhodocyclaceae bacterium]
MKMHQLVGRCVLALCAGGGLAGGAHANTAANPVEAATAVRDQTRVDLTRLQSMFDELLADQRDAFADNMLVGMGSRGKLGPDWKRGNVYYDREHAMLCAALEDEEARSGRLVGLSQHDFDEAWANVVNDSPLAQRFTAEQWRGYADIAEFIVVARVFQEVTGRSAFTADATARIQQALSAARPDARPAEQVLAALAEHDLEAAQEIKSMAGKFGKAFADAMFRNLSRRLSIAYFRINGDLSQVTADYRESTGLAWRTPADAAVR